MSGNCGAAFADGAGGQGMGGGGGGAASPSQEAWPGKTRRLVFLFWPSVADDEPTLVICVHMPLCVYA